ncbi:MAG: DUF2237 family protein [Pirellulales bacterium]
MRSHDRRVLGIFQTGRQRSFHAGHRVRLPRFAPGDQWCLCVERWKEAYDAGMAPRVILRATHMSTLEFVSLEELQEYEDDGVG